MGAYRTINVVFDTTCEQLFVEADPLLYSLALESWSLYRMVPPVYRPPIDVIVTEVAATDSRFSSVAQCDSLLQTAIYIFFQIDTLMLIYDDWLVIDIRYQQLSETFIVSMYGVPGERYVRQQLLIGNR